MERRSRGSSSVTSPSSVVEETGGGDVTTTTSLSIPAGRLEELLQQQPEGAVEVDLVAGVGVGSDEPVTDDSSQEMEMETDKNTTTATIMTHVNGDDIIPEAVDTVVREHLENHQTQQHQQHNSDPGIDLSKSSQQPPPSAKAPEVSLANLAEDST